MQHVQFSEKRGSRKCKSIKEKSSAKGNKGSGDLRARLHPANFPICAKKLKRHEKEIYKSVGPTMVLHTFYPSTEGTEGTVW